jgi:tight adherence protein B
MSWSHVLGRGHIRDRIDRLVVDTTSSDRPAHEGPRLELAAGVAMAAVVSTVVLGLRMALVLAVGGLGARLWWQRHQVARRARRRQAQIPEALERLASALRSGSSLPQALAEAGRSTAEPLGPELAGLARDAGRGRSLLDVLDGWAACHDDHATRLAATALALAAGVGAAPARAVDGVAATLRERLELAGERRALATQARTSATVLSAAPVGFALLLGLTDGAAGRFLLGTPQGWACLIVGVGLDVLGAVWMQRLTQSEATL